VHAHADLETITGRRKLTDTSQQPADQVNPAEDGFLYHYTSLDVLTKVISNKTMWASHIKFLNDTSEQEILKSLILDKLLLPLATEPLTKKLSNDLNLYFSRVSHPMFVICFSEDGGDRLSQWRAYGGSSGVCLAFRKQALREWCLEDRGERAVTLAQVHYVPPDGNDLTRSTVENILDDFQSRGDDTLNPLWSLPENVHISGALFKHKAFEEEQEWRLLIQTLDDNIKYKTRGSLLVPYVEFNFGTALPDLLTAVKVGPILHKDQTAEAIKGLLRANGFRSTKTDCSQTPYRGF
jgi:hypothetical protein